MSEDEMFDDLAERIQQMQVKARERAQKRNSSAPLKRGFHAKGTGVLAKFEVRSDIPRHCKWVCFNQVQSMIPSSDSRTPGEKSLAV